MQQHSSDTTNEALCDASGCQNEATAFDSERVMFVCDAHASDEQEVEA
jgi:hypothetical protein